MIKFIVTVLLFAGSVALAGDIKYVYTKDPSDFYLQYVSTKHSLSEYHHTVLIRGLVESGTLHNMYIDSEKSPHLLTMLNTLYITPGSMVNFTYDKDDSKKNWKFLSCYQYSNFVLEFLVSCI